MLPPGGQGASPAEHAHTRHYYDLVRSPDFLWNPGANTLEVIVLFFSLPSSASLAQLVRRAHHRWAIEQQYQDLKTEFGLDHFEGRTYPGWQHHLVISAVAYAFVQRERLRPRDDPRLTLRKARAFVQEIFTGLLFISRPCYMQWVKEAELRFLQLRV